MFRRTSLFVTCALLSSQACAGTPPPLQPTSEWKVSDGDTLCIASRTYGSPGGPVSFSIVPSPNGQTYELLIGSKYTTGERAIDEEGSVDFGSGPIRAWALFYQTANRSSDVHDFRIPAAEMVRAGSAGTITLHVSGSSDFAFATGSMRQVLSQLQACTAQLKRHWNMGGEKNGEFSRQAHADLRSLFSPEDYPLQALRHGQGGKGQYLLLVDERGKVDGCQVLQPTGVPVLDVTACVVIEDKGKFTPALDKSGKPVRSTVITPPISWSVR